MEPEAASEEASKKKQRAERFGGAKTVAPAVAVTDPELLAKLEARAKRFALPAATA